MSAFDKVSAELAEEMAGDMIVGGLPFLDELVEALFEQLIDGLAGAWCRRDPLDVLTDSSSRDARYAAGKIVLRANQRGGFGLTRDQANTVREHLLTTAGSTPRETLVAMRDEARRIHIPDYTLV